jgi:hypothetical protein
MRPEVTVTVTETQRTVPSFPMSTKQRRTKTYRYHWTDEAGIRHNELSPPRWYGPGRLPVPGYVTISNRRIAMLIVAIFVVSVLLAIVVLAAQGFQP